MFTFTSLGISSVTTLDHILFSTTYPVSDNSFSSQLPHTNTYPTQLVPFFELQRSCRFVVAVAKNREFTSFIVHTLPPCLLTAYSALFANFVLLATTQLSSALTVANDREFASLVILRLLPYLLTIYSALYGPFRPLSNIAVILLLSPPQTTVSLFPSLFIRYRLVC